MSRLYVNQQKSRSSTPPHTHTNGLFYLITWPSQTCVTHKMVCLHQSHRFSIQAYSVLLSARHRLSYLLMLIRTSTSAHRHCEARSTLKDGKQTHLRGYLLLIGCFLHRALPCARLVEHWLSYSQQYSHMGVNCVQTDWRTQGKIHDVNSTDTQSLPNFQHSLPFGHLS